MSATSEAERLWREAHRICRNSVQGEQYCSVPEPCHWPGHAAIDAAVRAAYFQGAADGSEDPALERELPPWLPAGAKDDARLKEDDREAVLPGDERDHIPGDYFPAPPVGAKEDK